MCRINKFVPIITISMADTHEQHIAQLASCFGWMIAQKTGKHEIRSRTPTIIAITSATTTRTRKYETQPPSVIR